MPPTARKTTSRKPPARTPAPRATRPPAVVEPEEDIYPDAAEAQEIEADGRYVTAELCGEQIQIIPPGAWRQSWQRLLANGQGDAFAELVVHPDDLELYFELDPTNAEFGEFVEDAGRRAGESLGNSRGPARPARRTRRR